MRLVRLDAKTRRPVAALAADHSERLPIETLRARFSGASKDVLGRLAERVDLDDVPEIAAYRLVAMTVEEDSTLTQG